MANKYSAKKLLPLLKKSNSANNDKALTKDGKNPVFLYHYMADVAFEQSYVFLFLFSWI
jgi:hypothetical protein